jgi:hypothetical protein
LHPYQISCESAAKIGGDKINYHLMSEYLFSYGTLQLEKVQLESFGRILSGTNDSLTGYKLASLKITDESVLQKSEQPYHPIAIRSENQNDQVEGKVFEVSYPELLKADAYEVKEYRRIAVVLVSGKKAWVYVSAE